MNPIRFVDWSTFFLNDSDLLRLVILVKPANVVPPVEGMIQVSVDA